MKILIVSHNCFSKVYNNGKTLESIFSSFPQDSLSQIYFTEDMQPDFDFCSNYFKITDVNVLKCLFNFSNNCGEILVPNGNAVSDGLPDKSKVSNIFKFAKSKIDHLVLFRDILWSFNSWKSKLLFDWCEKINPDVIFYVGGNFGFSHNIASSLSKKFQIPLVTYFTDDYLIYPKSKSLLDRVQKIRMRKFYQKTVKHSSLNFTIGDEMTEVYSGFFGKEFYSIMNSIKKEDYLPYYKKTNVTLSYFGGLHLNRWMMLIKLAQALKNGCINVYSIEKPTDEVLLEFERVNIKFKGAVKDADLKYAILNSDVLLHVESDDPYNRTLTKLSVSTKIPEYLMSGRLVLGFGPAEVASMKILSDNSIGVVISSSISNESLKSELVKITSNFELRKKMGLAGHNYAIKNFDNEIISKNFKIKIENLILNHEN